MLTECEGNISLLTPTVRMTRRWDVRMTLKWILEKQVARIGGKWKWKYPMVGFGITNVETSGSITRELVG
jgi:hypothetical protein